MRLDNKHMTIIAMVRQAKVCPSRKEIAQAIGLGTSATNLRIARLEEAGYLKVTPGAARAMAVTEKGKLVFPEFVIAKERDGVLSLYQSS